MHDGWVSQNALVTPKQLFKCHKQGLTLYHTMPSEGSLLKTLWERDKMLVASIFYFFPQLFLPNQRNIESFDCINLSSINDFNLKTGKFVRLVKGKKDGHTCT